MFVNYLENAFKCQSKNGNDVANDGCKKILTFSFQTNQSTLRWYAPRIVVVAEF